MTHMSCFINNHHKLDHNNYTEDHNNNEHNNNNEYENEDEGEGEGDEGWETRAGAQDADVSQAPGMIFFSIFFIYLANFFTVRSTTTYCD